VLNNRLIYDRIGCGTTATHCNTLQINTAHYMHIPCSPAVWMPDVGQWLNTNQENRHFAELVLSSKVQFGAGDLNLAVSTSWGPSHAVMSEISTNTFLRYMPALAYHDGKLCQENVFNVHDRGAGQCYDMCLVLVTNDTFSAKFFAIPGDVAYLLALPAIVDKDPLLNNGHVVHYYNRKRSDHRTTMLIESWWCVASGWGFNPDSGLSAP